MSVLFSRDDLISALRQLTQALPQHEGIITIRIVGGAALALRFFERSLTRDIDAVAVSPLDDQVIRESALLIAREQGWPEDWLNFEVMKADAIPQLGKVISWEQVVEGPGFVIEVASPEAMLAMKLRANRPGRDTDDIRQLMGLCGATTLKVLEELYEEYYPGDILPERAIQLVINILDAGIPTSPEKLPRVNL